MARPRTTSSVILTQLQAEPKLLSELVAACGCKASGIRSAISRLRQQHYDIIGSSSGLGWKYEWRRT